ncbi:peptidoglycan-binding domain-containing protein [Anabaena sp. CCY 9910]|uniref:peptidoglycan-binding domain-containing protein n=1 Tax=Anabaena sp. CCY 9910 TaxID=3103870 RepID=UPI0039DFC59A
MEFIAYSSMFIANQEANGQADIDYELPKINLNLPKLFKSSAWLSLTGFIVFFTAITQVSAAFGAYVRTNGSCLNVRVSPYIGSRIVDCIPNGVRINNNGRVNGFVRLSRNRYVAARWVGGSYNYNNRPNNPNYGGVGGRFTLSYGSRGSAVSQVQRRLGINPTGYYGNTTVQLVREFQANNNLLVDGVVGPQTRRALFNTYSSVDEGYL